MKSKLKTFLLFTVLTLPPLCAQGSTGYTLTKWGDSGFIASNSTSISGNFFLLLTPNGPQVQSVTQDGGPSLSIQGSNGTSVIGPFSLPAGASVTLQVIEKGPVTGSQTHALSPAEGFVLLTESQLSRVQSLPLTSNSSVLTPDSTGRSLLHSAVAAPNVSRDNQAVDFLVGLNAPAMINLSLFTLAGEKVYGAQTQGSVGVNKLVWSLSDNTGGQVASGLYLFYVEAAGPDGSRETRVGKIVVVQ